MHQHLALLLLAMLTLATVASGARLRDDDDDDDEDRRSSSFRSHDHHEPRSHAEHELPGRRSSVASWRVASRWCRSRSGLPTLPTTDSSSSSSSSSSAAVLETAAETLAKRAATWPPGCYWLGNAYDDPRLSWLVENGHRRTVGRISSLLRRCLCVRGGGGGRSNSEERPLKLRLESCHKRLPFHCDAASTAAAAATTRNTPAEAKAEVAGAVIKKKTKTSSTTTKPPLASTTTTKTYEDALEDVPEDPDEAVDHGKFPAFELRPDGHPKGWLPPWTELTTPGATGAAPTIKTATDEGTKTMSSSSNSSNETAGTNAGGGMLPLLVAGQRSEFVTLLVLYTIVAVICVVLLGLCLVRCCRGYCGHAKIRYVRQVDADDIPRFMPSSWA